MKNNTCSAQRNYGIDLLRLVAAFYVIILHTVLQGGLLYATPQYSYQNYVCQILLICSFCAVNIFGIISGFVGYRESEKKFSLTGYASLWIDVVFYSVTLTLVYMRIRPDAVTSDQLTKMFFPVTRNLYWYFSAYTMVYFLAPFLNQMVRKCSVSELKYLFCLILFIFVPVDFIGGSFSLLNGYSPLWLILLYLIGAIMKKTGLGSGIRPVTAIFLLIVLDVCLFFFFTKCPEITFLSLCIHFSFEFHQTYVCPFFLAAAILHVIVFAQLKPGAFAQKAIRLAAPAAFSAYIINVQECVWLYLMKDLSSSWAGSSPVGIIGKTIIFSFLFVLAAVIIDFCKRNLFHILKIDIILRKLTTVSSKDTAV